jgi:hypothetical protein
MSYGVVTPTVPLANDIMLGEGVVYYNYGAGGDVIGATRGGSKITMNKKVINIKYDGAYGETKGLKRIDTFVPKFEINFLKVDYNTLGYGLPKTITDRGAYHEIAFNLNWSSSDVLTNIAFIGQKLDGKLVKAILSNAINSGNISFNFKEKDEIVNTLEYQGLYAAATPTVPPIVFQDYDV